MSTGRCFLFTMTTGRSGTAYLADILRSNIVDSECHHEIFGWDKLGIDTPDVSHMAQFNMVGNVDHVKKFWRKKMTKIANCSKSFYCETSHLLIKSGLAENIDHLSTLGHVHLIDLRRDMFSAMISMLRRRDFVSNGNAIMWYLDTGYTKNILKLKPKLDAALGLVPAWYILEMRARAEFYRQKFLGSSCVSVHTFNLEDIVQRDGASKLLSILGYPKDPAQIDIPERSNINIRQLDIPKNYIDNFTKLVEMSQQYDLKEISRVAVRGGHSFT